MRKPGLIIAVALTAFSFIISWAEAEPGDLHAVSWTERSGQEGTVEVTVDNINGYTIQVGIDEGDNDPGWTTTDVPIGYWGDAENQTLGWHAVAGQLPGQEIGEGYLVTFEYEFYSWDVYSEPSGAGTGYLDNAGVNVKTGSGAVQDNAIWADPTISDPAPFIVHESGPPESHPSDWDGNTWSWGTSQLQFDVADSRGTGSGHVAIDGLGVGTDLFVTVFLSTGLDDTSTGLPTWGQFTDLKVVETPEPAASVLLVLALVTIGVMSRRRRRMG